MLDNETILKIAQHAAKAAANLMDFDVSPDSPNKGSRYSVILVSEPDVPEDAYFNTDENEIQINVATVEPFPDTGGLGSEDKRLAMKICYITYHEMRHYYQKRAVETYMINKMCGGHLLRSLENDKKCALWQSELEGYVRSESGETDLEADADAFADYMICRYPWPVELRRTNRRLGVMKRKYDKREIMAAEI